MIRKKLFRSKKKYLVLNYFISILITQIRRVKSCTTTRSYIREYSISYFKQGQELTWLIEKWTRNLKACDAFRGKDEKNTNKSWRIDCFRAKRLKFIFLVRLIDCRHLTLFPFWIVGTIWLFFLSNYRFIRLKALTRTLSQLFITFLILDKSSYLITLMNLDIFNKRCYFIDKKKWFNSALVCF